MINYAVQLALAMIVGCRFMVDLSEMVQNNLPPLPKVIFNILMEVPSVILNYFFDTVITTFYGIFY